MITLMETQDSYIYLYINLKNNAESSWEDMHKIVFTSGAGGWGETRWKGCWKAHFPIQLCGIMPCTDIFPIRMYSCIIYIIFRHTSVLKRQ